MSGPTPTLLFILGLTILPAQQTRRPEQSQTSTWNSPQVTSLIRRAIGRRFVPDGLDSLGSYRARAQGHIYFLFDTGRDTERQLVKADQVALDILWRAPDQYSQIFIGHREEKMLPTDITYHIDHLLVVMSNFGDSISLGEGSEVNDVVHPLARDALNYYEYRLADSLTLVLPEREVWLYKVELRPRDLASPGIVGAIYLDRDSADVARMQFTFTASSYLDPQLDFINVRIQNALWDGRYWLPHQQGVELRREYNVLSFPAGGVIRTEIAIGDYELNAELPANAFRGPEVRSLGREQLEMFEFADGLYDALDPAVATEAPTLEQIRREATELVAQTYLQRTEGLKLAVPGVSSVLRFRRAEGLYIGPGLSRSVPGGIQARVLGGYAIGSDRWQLDASVSRPVGGGFEIELAGYANRSTDLSPWAASSGLVATFATLADGEDFKEPYWADGASLALSRTLGAVRTRLAAAWEDWEAAELEADEVVDRSYRAVRPMHEGEALTLGLDLDKPLLDATRLLGGLAWAVRVEGATPSVAGDFEYLRGAARAEGYVPSLVGEVSLRLTSEAGAVGGGAIPAQRLFVGGGRGSVRGYAFNRFGGNLFAFFRTELSRSLKYPYLTALVFADVGWIGLEGESAREAASLWSDAGSPVDESDGALVGVGAGVGLLFDIVRLEIARGLRLDGEWEILFRVNPKFWAWL